MNSSIKTIQLIPPSQQSNSSINSSNQTYGITGGSGFSKQKSPKRSYQKKNSTKKFGKVKRFDEDNDYLRPKTTYQDTLQTKEAIKKKLTHYVESQIETIPIGTHVRYISLDKDKKPAFRLGGFIKIIHPKYVILSNKKFNWSVQRFFFTKNGELQYKTRFFKKMTERDYLDKEKRFIEREKKKIQKKLQQLKKRLENA